MSNALEFSDPLHNRERQRASQTRNPTGKSKHSLFSPKVPQTNPEEWIIGVKFKKNHVCKQMNNQYVQSSWPCVISKHIHTRTAIAYLTCCCGPVTTLALWATAVPLGADMLHDGRPLSGKLTQFQRDWFCRELTWHKTWVVPLTWLLLKDKILSLWKCCCKPEQMAHREKEEVAGCFCG